MRGAADVFEDVVEGAPLGSVRGEGCEEGPNGVAQRQMGGIAALLPLRAAHEDRGLHSQELPESKGGGPAARKGSGIVVVRTASARGERCDSSRSQAGTGSGRREASPQPRLERRGGWCALAESLGGGVHRHEAARVNEVGIGRLPLGVLHLETAAP